MLSRCEGVCLEGAGRGFARGIPTPLAGLTGSGRKNGLALGAVCIGSEKTLPSLPRIDWIETLPILDCGRTGTLWRITGAFRGAEKLILAR
jgi:hypothetical protein